VPANPTATTRYGLAQAPGGLALVQDVVNTRAADRPRQADLLHGDVGAAQDWFADLVQAWSAATDAPTAELPQLSLSDLPRIRNLRETLTQVLRRDEATGVTAALATTSVRLELTGDGTAHLAPGGSAAQWLTGVVLGEIFRAQATGAWRRLKVCRNVACSGAFYDLSRNNSRVWHDVHRCGNIANLRASRARRRAGDTLLVPPEA
jgi:predicted RNA-binding Zn ribbon-like protein